MESLSSGFLLKRLQAIKTHLLLPSCRKKSAGKSDRAMGLGLGCAMLLLNLKGFHTVVAVLDFEKILPHN